jgi:hypothetical protein
VPYRLIHCKKSAVPLSLVLANLFIIVRRATIATIGMHHIALARVFVNYHSIFDAFLPPMVIVRQDLFGDLRGARQTTPYSGRAAMPRCFR